MGSERGGPRTSLIQFVVTGGAVALVTALARFFLSAGPEPVAEVGADVEEATVVVRGGNQPNVVRAKAGTPLRLTFDRFAPAS